MPPEKMDATTGFAPAQTGFADRPLAVWARRALDIKEQRLEPAGIAPTPRGLKVRRAAVDTTTPKNARAGSRTRDCGLADRRVAATPRTLEKGRPDGSCTRIFGLKGQNPGLLEDETAKTARLALAMKRQRTHHTGFTAGRTLPVGGPAHVYHSWPGQFSQKNTHRRPSRLAEAGRIGRPRDLTRAQADSIGLSGEATDGIGKGNIFNGETEAGLRLEKQKTHFRLEVGPRSSL